MGKGTLASAGMVALLALAGCSSTDAAPEEAEQDAEAVEAKEIEESGLSDESVEELIKRENEAAEKWMTSPVDSEDEVDAEAKMQEVYDELETRYPDVSGLEEDGVVPDDLPEELEGLWAVQELRAQEAAAEDPITGDREFTGRTEEDVDAEFGEAVDVDQGPFTNEGDYMGTLTLNGVERGFTDAECAEWDYTTQNGEFVALDITINADEEAGEEFSVTESDFYVVDEKDTMLRDELHSYEAWACADDVGALQAAQPGTNTSGLVMLDFPEGLSGTLVYSGGVHEVRWEL
ncbi:hypothetical protein [Nesterenkonia halobia]|uniref:DUF4352 domain-containing protein n=1 Tax=Nesterenkonia halobia TaxID=37922 RepID=A0ABP6RC31_9MICC